ncbi:MAG: 1-acyl-sn-glycerol-3-phosphate acyltransferase [Candidatus Omnitrophica bacterium]|nr:1-acyl-sn-glycerol-3-phosphate acyltransferase [Candidatus Omnitrophota bacterium]MBU0895654.1 1-acyl-sn-glycerol-3-phosphate acyltransferase [Candidatus Omnitrophota bacterium]MBU1038404.1 1-acyl-sn-glycerol-3-phosphate acyltransferase [Candidatus Omnitrophota bacterium]MBU1808781.1 1-acyl-sn-glycerol-3-phosphate acyltransferase [Candidatus Omnitrophota bacterium]
MRLAISILIWIAGVIITIAAFLVSFILSIALFPFPDKEKIIHAQCFWWSNAIIALNPYWTIKVNGLENIDPLKTYVIVANHQSLADIVIIYQTRMYFKWVAKEELLRVPFIGGLLWVNKHIMISRGNFGSIKEVYRKAAERLKGGTSMLFFPEGTRSITDEIGEFQNGAFKLAIKEGKAVLPILIGGTREAIPKGGFIFNTKVVGKLEVLPPVDTSNLKIADYAGLRDLVRGQLQSAARGV